MQGSCRCQAWQATTRHLVVKKIPRPLIYFLIRSLTPQSAKELWRTGIALTIAVQAESGKSNFWRTKAKERKYVG
jgi:hypothetical protein